MKLKHVSVEINTVLRMSTKRILDILMLMYKKNTRYTYVNATEY